MKTARVTLSTDEKEIEYLLDLEKQVYRSSSYKMTEGIRSDEVISEEGPLGDQSNKQMIVNRIHYVLLATLSQ